MHHTRRRCSAEKPDRPITASSLCPVPTEKRFPTGSASKKAVPVWGIVMAAHTFDPSTHGRQRLRQADVCVFETRST